MSCKDKIVLITGASAGIGEASAIAFAKLGAKVIISARTQSKLEALKARLENEYDACVHLLPLDVSDRAAVKNAVDSLDTQWRDVDILVNNAGLALGLDKIQDGNLDDWDRMIDTNIKGLLYVTHYMLPGMIARNSGHVINIGSMSGHEVYSGGVVYCATKFAVKAISDGLKKDVHDTKIRITEIDPGAVNTEFSATRFSGDRERADAVYDGFDALSADDIASAITYAANCPSHVDVRSIQIYPTAQTAAHLLKKEC